MLLQKTQEQEFSQAKVATRSGQTSLNIIGRHLMADAPINFKLHPTIVTCLNLVNLEATSEETMQHFVCNSEL